MSKTYAWLWFDADGTLFDFHAAEAGALEQTFAALELDYRPEHLAAYRQINATLWSDLEAQRITPLQLRERRFNMLLETLQLTGSADAMSEAYLEFLATGSNLIEGAYEVVETLSKRVQIALLTNGLEVVQRGRLARSPLRTFISQVVISEEIGVAKPDVVFFDVAAARCGRPDKTKILMIGDSFTSDMQGGINYGSDTCWYNPASLDPPASLPITYQIASLEDLLDLVEAY